MEKIKKTEKAGSLFLAMAVAVAVMLGALPAVGQDPCSQTTKLSATASGVQTWNGTKSATTVGGSGDDAYGVEAWTEAGGNATKLTWYGPNQGGGYAFRAEWTNSTDYLGRFGYFWGNNGKKWSNLGDLCVDYNYTRSANGSGGSYSYLGIYGWTIGSSNSAEYYIVEDWFGSSQQSASNLGNNCQTHGNITVDGKTYQVVTCIRPQGSGCVSCNNQAFGQVFSIRQGMRNPEPAKCGTISIKKHFEEWTKMTTEKSGQSPAKYIYDKTYESKFLAEAAGGTGWFEASYMKFSRTGGCGASTTPPTTYTLTTAISPTAGGTVTKNPNNANYNSGTSVTVTASPAAGYTFDKWSGDATGNTNPLSVTMNANKTVTATFVQKPITKFTLTATASPTAGGTITATPAASDGKYDSATVVKLKAKANEGYTFSGWSGGATGTADSVNVTMNANKTVTATFVQKPITKFTLTATASPAAGGTITATPAASDGKYDSATVVKLKAKANEGYLFSGWSGATSATDSVNVTMNANKTVTATFVPKAAAKFTLTATASPTDGGRIDVSPPSTSDAYVAGQYVYDSATVVKLKAVANEGYTFSGWDGDGIGPGPAIPAADSITVTMNANKTITATFTQKTGIARDALYAKNKRGLTVTPVSNSALNVGFTAKNGGAASINLYSLKGDLLASAKIQTTAGAYHSHTISAAKLPTGFYVVKVIGDGFTEQARAVMPR